MPLPRRAANDLGLPRMTSAIVLAGGASTRFGGDKLSAALDGRTLLDHALEAVGAIANPVVVVIAPDAARRPVRRRRWRTR